MTRDRAPWIGVAVLCAMVCTAIDIVVLDRRFGIFTIGFLTSFRVTGLGLPYFVLGSLLVDAAVASVLAWPALWATRALSPARRLVAATLLCIAVIVGVAVARYEIDRFVGDTLQYHFAKDAAVNTRLLGLFAIGLAAATGSALALVLVRFVPDRALACFLRGSATPGRGVLHRAALLLLALLFLFVTGLRSPDMQIQFERKSTGLWLVGFGERATDFDGDGFGLLLQPTDNAPFDAAVHPYAVDRPGNGVDENGIGGDLRRRGDFTFERYGPAAFRQTPDVLLIVLESFRADNVGATVDGKPVAPVLAGLVRDGAVTGPAYSHNGYTIQSLSHLFSGSLTLTVSSSIVDDFNENGYTTACISGEDESFGGIRGRTGLLRTDFYRDARDDKKDRTTAFATPGSLTVPWTVLVRNVDTLLEQRRGKDDPLFCYVNFQDCHFPYHNQAIEPLLSDNPIPRSAISKENLEWTRRTYRNTAANVDRAIGRMLELWEQKRGRRPAFVIVSDHGESFFQNGVLGHGIKITPDQTKIVFIAGGLGVDCVFPLGLADVRRLLRDALSGNETTPRARVDPRKWIFQYIGSLRRPGMLGGAMANGGVVYRFREDDFQQWGEPTKPYPDLATYWEQIALHRAGR